MRTKKSREDDEKEEDEEIDSANPYADFKTLLLKLWTLFMYQIFFTIPKFLKAVLFCGHKVQN